MVGVLIVTHGRLGEALIESARMISGSTDGAKALAFLPGQGVEDLEAALRNTLATMGSLDGTLCLVDLPGGSPARVAAMLSAEHPAFEVVAGANLPMVVEVLLMRDAMSASELAEHAARSGSEGVVNIRALLRAELAEGGEG
jgi:mannose/fructose/sorbose-specific phosphotransferase system IIA component